MNRPNFKVGDVVICVNDNLSPFIHGRQYKILSIRRTSDWYVGVLDLVTGKIFSDGWFASRFKKVNNHKNFENKVVSFSIKEPLEKLKSKGFCLKYVEELEKKYKNE